jgi:Archaeal/vacuolar-type H+-ATPase subunit A
MSHAITAVNGPVVRLSGGGKLRLLDMVSVGALGLIGELVAVDGDTATAQLYEDTAGLQVGEAVIPLHRPMSLRLGPGLLGGIFDGIARPLDKLAALEGAFLARGSNLTALDEEKRWDVTLLCKPGDVLSGGASFASCPETAAITHCALVPPQLSGMVTWTAENGSYTVTDPVATLTDPAGEKHTLTLAQDWPIRTPRPLKRRLPVTRPLITGQRVIDSFFPIGKGGTAALPGPFGAGKTMTQHQLAKWADADIIVYLGCGERGNEMTQALAEFSALTDPRTDAPLMARTILIANTSNMPVSAREASVYTGMTLAEYYRDMGYHVALMADSTSRWAEALRELSGRLEEMPAEEGFPAYLASRLAEFYERVGVGETLSGREGSVTAIGAVSPQGGDFSEPVTENTRRFVRVFWALDRSLAYSRHFPAIHWMSSYSAYDEALAPYFAQEAGADFLPLRRQALALLQEEASLLEIVKLIGGDLLPEEQKLILETARTLRLGFLQQNAFHAVDTFVPLPKQRHMLAAILHLHARVKQRLTEGIPLQSLTETGIFETLTHMKYDIGNDDAAAFARLHAEIEEVTSRAY